MRFNSLIQSIRDRRLLSVGARNSRRHDSPAVASPHPPVSIDDPKSILIVRNDKLGDNILTSPLLRAVRRKFGTAKISLLTSPIAAGLYRWCPYVDTVYVQDCRPHFQPLLRFIEVWSTAMRLFRDARFDLAILPRWDQDGDGGVLMAVMSGAPERMGYSTCVNPDEYPRNRGLDRFLTRRLDDPSVKHEVLRALELARRLGVADPDDTLELWPSAEDQRWAHAFVETLGLPTGGQLIALGVGGSRPTRVWPLSRLLEVARRVSAAGPSTFLLVGGPEDRAGAEMIAGAHDISAINLCGSTSLNQLAALLQRAHLYVGNDTGAMHLAAAAGVPCVVVSCHPLNASVAHSSSPERFHPWGVPFRYARPRPMEQACADGCRGAAAHCILNVSVDDVVEQWGTLPGRDHWTATPESSRALPDIS